MSSPVRSNRSVRSIRTNPEFDIQARATRAIENGDLDEIIVTLKEALRHNYQQTLKFISNNFNIFEALDDAIDENDLEKIQLLTEVILASKGNKGDIKRLDHSLKHALFHGSQVAIKFLRDAGANTTVSFNELMDLYDPEDIERINYIIQHRFFDFGSISELDLKEFAEYADPESVRVLKNFRNKNTLKEKALMTGYGITSKSNKAKDITEWQSYCQAISSKSNLHELREISLSVGLPIKNNKKFLAKPALCAQLAIQMEDVIGHVGVREAVHSKRKYTTMDTQRKIVNNLLTNQLELSANEREYLLDADFSTLESLVEFANIGLDEPFNREEFKMITEDNTYPINMLAKFLSITRGRIGDRQLQSLIQDFTQNPEIRPELSRYIENETNSTEVLEGIVVDNLTSKRVRLLAMISLILIGMVFLVGAGGTLLEEKPHGYYDHQRLMNDENKYRLMKAEISEAYRSGKIRYGINEL